MSGRVEMTAQARPTSSATTRFTTIHGRRICSSEPGGLEKVSRYTVFLFFCLFCFSFFKIKKVESESSPQSLIGCGIKVDAITGHLLTEGQDQGYEIHWKHRETLQHFISISVIIVILPLSCLTYRKRPEQQGPGWGSLSGPWRPWPGSLCRWFTGRISD